MGTTTNMSIPYPESSDYVADGATAMENIATQVDAKTGLIVMSSQSFSAVSSLTIDGCFTSTFRNYRVVINVVGSASTGINGQFRYSGTTDTSANYNRTGWYYLGSSFASLSTTGQTAMYLGAWSTAAYSPITLDIIVPNEATATRALHNAAQSDSNLLLNLHHYVNTSTAYDGLYLAPSTGTMSGHIGIYAYEGT